jgi:hypothetical protein
MQASEMDDSAAQIPAPPNVKDWAPFELARSFDSWLSVRGIDYLDLGEGGELDRLRSEWLHREGGERDRLRFAWLRREAGASPRTQT